MGILFNKLCSTDCLYAAWKLVRSKKSAGGIDGLSLYDFEEDLRKNLKALQEELSTGNWNPEPYLRVEIRKNETEKRKLGLLSIKDKIVQQAIRSQIEPVLEKIFLSNSYGYRPGKGHTKAIRRTLNEIRAKKNGWIAQLDIDDYFDTINHDLLFSRLQHVVKDPEVMRLIELSVKMGCVTKKMKWTETGRGVPQGAVLSPLLANFYLHSFDQFIVSKTNAYIRYADDFIFLADSREQIDDLVGKASEFLTGRLMLGLNQPLVCEAKTGIEFLGVIVQDTGISVSDTKHQELLQRINAIELKDGMFTGKTMEGLDGIKRYYAQLLPDEVLRPFDQALDSAVSALIISPDQLFPDKKTLVASLKKLPLFSSEAELGRKEIIRKWTGLYIPRRKKVAKDGDKPLPQNKKLINQKKLEYQKKENEGSELVISSFGTLIGKNNRGITVKMNGKNVNKGPSNMLNHITVVTKGVTISSDAVQYCMNHHIPVDFFDNTGKLYASVLSPVFVDQSLWHCQSMMSLEKKAYLAGRIVYGKLKNQLNLMKYYHKYHKDNSGLSELFEELSPQMELLIEKAKQTDTKNADYAGTLIACEASGAVAYWSYLRRLMSDDGVDFETRTRKGATDLVNSLLNYGYSLLYARVWQAILSARLNPAAGVLHADQPGKPVLTFDIIELFRAQAVDRVVVGLVQKKEPLSVSRGLLDVETKKLLVQNILERINRYENYRSEEIKFAKIITEQVRDIAGYIAGETRSFRPYIAKW